MSDCYCDYERPAVYRSARHKAGRAYCCDECGAEIARGETYERVWAIWDGAPGTARTCCDCLAIRDALATMNCFCWSHHGLWEDVHSQLVEADFPVGARFGYLRLIVTHRAHRGRRRHAPHP